MKLRWVLPFLLIVVLVGLSVPTAPPSAQAQGIFGCPFESQADCELLIAALDNTRALDTVHIDDLSLVAFFLADSANTTVQASVSGPTVLTDGDVTSTDWASEIVFGSTDAKWGLRLLDGVLYVDTDTRDAASPWYEYDPSSFGAGSFDVPGLISTVTLSDLLDILNEVGDGVTWTRGQDTRINGVAVGMFTAEFSTASLVSTAFANEQITNLLLSVIDLIGLDAIDADILQFVLDFLIDMLQDQLGGATFEITWLVGIDDEQLYGLSIEGNASLDLTLLSMFVGAIGEALPSQLSVTFDLNLNLSEHNAAVSIDIPENVEGAGSAIFDELFKGLLGDIFGDSIFNFGSDA